MMAITPAIAANTAPTCGIVIVTKTHLKGRNRLNALQYLYNIMYRQELIQLYISGGCMLNVSHYSEVFLIFSPQNGQTILYTRQDKP